jgi:hypothetical protein
MLGLYAVVQQEATYRTIDDPQSLEPRTTKPQLSQILGE